MGCFNVVCSISNIPIHCGQDAVIIYVAKDTGYDHSYQPISFPLFGEYDDYGELEEIEEDFSYKWFNNIIIPLFKDVTKPTCRKNTSLGVLQDEVRCGIQVCPDEWASGNKAIFKEEQETYGAKRIYYELIKSNGTRVKKLFIHKKVYDKLIELSGFNIKDKEEDIDTFIDYFSKEEKDGGPSETQLMFGRFNCPLLPKPETYREHWLNGIFETGGCGGYAEPISGIALNTYRDLFLSACKEEIPAFSPKDFLIQFTKQAYLTRAMHSVNKSFEPFPNYCTQSQDIEEANSIVKLLDVCKDVQQEFIDNKYGYGEWE